MSDHATRVRQEFSRQADTLATAPVFTDEALLARLCAAAQLTRTARVLDVASGPGARGGGTTTRRDRKALKIGEHPGCGEAIRL